MNTSKEKSQSVGKILDRVKKAEKLTTDVELARLFGVKPNTISAWRKRNSMDYGLLFTKCAHINADWLIYGKDIQYKINKPSQTARVTEPLNEQEIKKLADFEHQVEEIVDRIKNGPWSAAAKISLIDSLLHIVEKDLAAIHQENEHSDSHPGPSVDDQS